MTSSPDFQLTIEQRYIELQTLAELARSLNAVLDLDELLSDIVDVAVRLSNAEEGLLLLPDEDGTTLRIRAMMGIDTDTARDFRIKTDDTLAGQVFRTGRPILIGHQGWQKVKTQYLVKSLLYVPLTFKKQVVGVLGVNNKRADRSFTEHDIDLLQDLAAHAAIAIENARLYEESQQRTRELSTLVRAGESANSTLDIDEVLAIFAQELIDALEVGQCYIGQYDAERDEFHLSAVCYRAIWRPGAGRTISAVDVPNLEHVLSQRRVRIVPELKPVTHTPVSMWLPHHYQARGVAYLPLFTEGKPRGLIIMYRMKSPYPDAYILDGEQTGLQQLGSEILEELRQGIGQPEVALYALLDEMLDIAIADWCDVMLWNNEHREFYTVVSYGSMFRSEGVLRSEKKATGLDFSQTPYLEAIIEYQQTVISPPDPVCTDLLDIVRGKSIVGLPLRMRDQTVGAVLLVDTQFERLFTPRELRLAQALVLQVANALSNAQLYRQLEVSLEELHRTQSKLVQTARLSAMGELAAAVAHQINNPLTTVLGDSEIILHDLPPDDINYESIAAIQRAGKRAHEVVRRLLTMARQQPADEQPMPLAVNETIENTLTLVKSHLQHGNVSLLIELADNLPLITGIQGQLEDVWLNLLLNARDAVADRPAPRIGIISYYDAAEDVVTVTIWDNGPGIPAELQQQIFDPFFTTKPPGEGTGLGLHICRQIVEKCQGSISLESVYNEGTRFLIHLPVKSGSGDENVL